MTFVLSKIVWFLASPTNLLLSALLLSGLTWSLARHRIGRTVAVACVLLLLLGGFLPAGYWLLRPLQDRFPTPETPLREIDGIVVLGGGLDVRTTARRQSPEFNAAGDRLVAMAALMRQFPAAKVLYTGGTGSVSHAGLRGADWVPAALEALGVDPARVIYEREARNTYENATFAARLAAPQAGQRWLLITSAYHMPRSMGAFRAAGWEPVPYPVDFRHDDPTLFPFRASERLQLLDTAVTEWMGLLSYRVLGRSDAWFPAPRGIEPAQ